MTRTKTLTEEQRKANRAKCQKKYMDKVWYYYHDYSNLEECYHFAAKCFRRSVFLNAILLVTTVLGWIF